MIDVNALLGRPIKIELRDGSYNKSLFKGLYLKNYKLKDILIRDGLDIQEYTSWSSAIITKPKDIADILWVKQNIYYKDLDEWLFVFIQCFDLQTNKIVKNSPLLKGLRYMFEYDFVPTINPNEDNIEKRFYFNIYNKNQEWLAKIDKVNFEKIREIICLVNYIKPNELSTWNYAYDKHEKKALSNYYKKYRERDVSKNKNYDFSLETVLRFLKLETHTSYEELLDNSLYEIYSCYSMKSSTYQTLALNVGIYGGNLKMDSNIRDNLLFGVTHNTKQTNNVSSGNLENVDIETK